MTIDFFLFEKMIYCQRFHKNIFSYLPFNLKKIRKSIENIPRKERSYSYLGYMGWEYSSAQIDKLFHGPDCPEQRYAVFNFILRYE